MKSFSTLRTVVVTCTTVAAIAGGLAGCGSGSDGAAANNAATRTPERFELTTEAIAKSELGIETVGKTAFSLSRTVPGQILVDEARSVHVAMTLAGTVREVRKNLGDQVQVGDVLAVIDSRDLADAVGVHLAALAHLELANADQARATLVADNTGKLLALIAQNGDSDQVEAALKDAPIGEYRARLMEASARLRAAKATYLREKELTDKRISSASDFAVAEEDYAAARARSAALTEEISYTSQRSVKETTTAATQATFEVASSKQKLVTLGLSEQDITKLVSDRSQPFTRYELKSPVAGSVVERRLSPGQVIAADQPAFFVADVSSVVVRLTIPVDQLDGIKTGQPIDVRAPNHHDAVRGQLAYLAPVVDQATGGVEARLHIPNAGGIWRPGMFVTGEVIIDELAATTAVQNDAIQVIGDAPVVFVQVGNAFEPRKLKLGRSDGRVTELLGGSLVSEGDRYVVGNSFVLKAHLLSLGGG